MGESDADGLILVDLLETFRGLLPRRQEYSLFQKNLREGLGRAYYIENRRIQITMQLRQDITDWLIHFTRDLTPDDAPVKDDDCPYKIVTSESLTLDEDASLGHRSGHLTP
jgi:hypothetical protein